MAEAVPFGQRWTYHSPHPISEMINPEYFKSETRFRAGDDLRVIEMKDGEVIAYSDLLITKVTKGRVISPSEFHVITEPKKIKEEPVKEEEVRLIQAKDGWELREGDNLINSYQSKKRAEAALASHGA